MIDELLLELQAAGQQDASGRFTLDLAKARTKLGRFQLEGYHFLVPLVACAVLSGAETLQLRLSPTELELEFDGQPFDGATLRALFSHLLSDSRRLRELAVGLNSAMGAGWHITLESHARLTVEADRFAVEERPSPSARVKIQLKKPAPVWRKLLGALGPPREAVDVLERYCALAPVELIVCGKPLRKPVDLGRCLVWSHLEPDTFTAPRLWLADYPDSNLHRRNKSGSRVSAVLALKAQAAGVRFVVDGVLTTTSSIFLGCVFVEGVVLCDGLTRDLSGTGLVQDERLALLVETLRQEVLAMLGELAVHYDHFEGEERELARRVLLDSLQSSVRADHYIPGMDNPLLDLPWFKLAGGEETGLRPLLEQYAQVSRLPVARVHHECRPGRGPLIVCVTPENEALLTAIFPDWEEYDPALERLVHAQAARRRWEGQAPAPPQLPAGDYLHRTKLVGFDGEVGLSIVSQPAEVFLYKHRRPLGSWLCPALPRGVVAAVNHDALRPSPHFDGVEAGDPVLVTLRDALIEHLPGLYHGARWTPHNHSREVEKTAVLAYLEFLGPGGRLPDALRHWSIFDTIIGSLVNLHEVSQEVERQGFVGVIWGRDERLRGGEMPRFLTLCVDQAGVKALQVSFGKTRVRDAEIEIRRLKARPDFYARAVQAPVLSGEVVVRRRFEDGEVGLVNDPEWEPVARARALLHGRLLADGTLVPVGFGPISAVADSQDLTPTGSYHNLGPNPDAAWEAWLARVARECRLLLPLVLAELPSLQETHQRLALRLILSQLRWELARPPDDTWRELAATITFPTVNWQTVTLQGLFEARDAGRGGYVGVRLEAPLFPDEVVVLLAREVAELLGLPNLEDELRVRQLEREGGTPLPARLGPLPEGTLHTLQPLTSLEGELGLLRDLASPSRVELLCRHRRYRTLEPRTLIPFAAVVNLESPADVLPQLENEALEAVLELARQPKSTNREYLLQLAVRASLKGEPPALVIQLRRAGLVRDLVSQGLISLETLTSAAAYAAVELLSEIPYKSLQAVAAEVGLTCLPVLTSAERELLSEVCTLLPLSEDFRLRARAHANRARPRLESLELAAHFPHERWLATLELQPFGLQGEIGVPESPRGEDYWLVCRERLPLARWQPPGAGLCGVVDGPFEPTGAWDGLVDPEQVRTALAPAVARLRDALSLKLPECTPAQRTWALRVLTHEAPEYARAAESEPEQRPPSAGDLQALRNLFRSVLMKGGFPLEGDPLDDAELDPRREAALVAYDGRRLRLSALALRCSPGLLVHPLYAALAPHYASVRQLSPRQLHELLLELA